MTSIFKLLNKNLNKCFTGRESCSEGSSSKGRSLHRAVPACCPARSQQAACTGWRQRRGLAGKGKATAAAAATDFRGRHCPTAAERATFSRQAEEGRAGGRAAREKGQQVITTTTRCSPGSGEGGGAEEGRQKARWPCGRATCCRQRYSGTRCIGSTSKARGIAEWVKQGSVISAWCEPGDSQDKMAVY